MLAIQSPAWVKRTWQLYRPAWIVATPVRYQWQREAEAECLPTNVACTLCCAKYSSIRRWKRKRTAFTADAQAQWPSTHIFAGVRTAHRRRKSPQSTDK
ncbi:MULTISPECIES: hypothetical protein [unclassified Xanthomonas]|uniref:hypothetical protein n=1 Tax=unclassified Xanthomonas TaxID=2643310 RepID=UPI00288B02EB|nr:MULTISPECIES: hypothetical protein [unclassified Xanthomonas]